MQMRLHSIKRTFLQILPVNKSDVQITVRHHNSREPTALRSRKLHLKNDLCPKPLSRPTGWRRGEERERGGGEGRGVEMEEKGERGAGKAVNNEHMVRGWGLLCSHISTGCRLDSVGVLCRSSRVSQGCGLRRRG
jgi:hypothetical protein